MKEKKIATELIAVSIGPKAAQDSIRTALAMGIDKGIHIETSLRTDQELQPLAVAKLLKEIVKVSVLFPIVSTSVQLARLIFSDKYFAFA